MLTEIVVHSSFTGSQRNIREPIVLGDTTCFTINIAKVISGVQEAIWLNFDNRISTRSQPCKLVVAVSVSQSCRNKLSRFIKQLDRHAFDRITQRVIWVIGIATWSCYANVAAD